MMADLGSFHHVYTTTFLCKSRSVTPSPASLLRCQIRRTVTRSVAVAVAENVRKFSIAASTFPVPSPCIVHKRGADILHDPCFNKHYV
ncbi:hypothetical protein QVD17_28521 [Tagetes erecta]|uniref:Uncharacterized protein n=1 Tax=Tagetes erecta TaxID=13708 RepID=A0AAD8NKJ2_TARER|nr:hypothetical protein QVD17_28521 [Tagetes erecta]